MRPNADAGNVSSANAAIVTKSMCAMMIAGAACERSTSSNACAGDAK